ncbi:MAG: helix-turn-helix transcriptional regulator [Ruminococcaceae bacterium]|nr:helix-turn-helix transcriptional regulator [Oscillospiraceae bacterium]
MDASFIRERISVLRIRKNVSEYKMSTDLGRSKNYIQSISSGRNLPSVSEFLSICEYLGVTPKEFFDTEINEPILIHELNDTVKYFSEDDLKVLISVAKKMKK